MTTKADFLGTDWRVLFTEDAEGVDWPTLTTPEGDGVPIFTSREKAEAFRDSSPSLSQFRLHRVSPQQLLNLLRACMVGGVACVVLDPAPSGQDKSSGRRALILQVLSEMEDGVAPHRVAAR